MPNPTCASCDGSGRVMDLDIIWAPCNDRECDCIEGHYVPDIMEYPCADCEADEVMAISTATTVPASAPREEVTS